MNDLWVPAVADRHDEEQVKSFYDGGIWRKEVLSDLLDRWSEERPQKVAVSDGQGELTYAELRGQAYRLAAARRSGAVLVPVVMYYRHDEVAYIAGQSAAKGIVTTGVFRKFDHLAMAREIRPQWPRLQFAV